MLNQPVAKSEQSISQNTWIVHNIIFLVEVSFYSWLLFQKSNAKMFRKYNIFNNWDLVLHKNFCKRVFVYDCLKYDARVRMYECISVIFGVKYVWNIYFEVN